MATKKMTPTREINTKVTRNALISLFMLIRDAKNSNLSRPALVKYVMLRVKLKALFDEYEKVRIEISEQTKPEGWKEGDSSEKWDEAFRPVMEEWLKEPAEINTNIFCEDECVDLIISNPDQPGTFADVVVEFLKL